MFHVENKADFLLRSFVKATASALAVHSFAHTRNSASTFLAIRYDNH
jgi:hypothetical protein